jgi:hypothetical protein
MFLSVVTNVCGHMFLFCSQKCLRAYVFNCRVTYVGGHMFIIVESQMFEGICL